MDPTTADQPELDYILSNVANNHPDPHQNHHQQQQQRQQQQQQQQQPITLPSIIAPIPNTTTATTANAAAASNGSASVNPNEPATVTTATTSNTEHASPDDPSPDGADNTNSTGGGSSTNPKKRPLEDKKARDRKRILRNRELARVSNERRKGRIKAMENELQETKQTVSTLEDSIRCLEEENRELRNLLQGKPDASSSTAAVAAATAVAIASSNPVNAPLQPTTGNTANNNVTTAIASSNNVIPNPPSAQPPG